MTRGATFQFDGSPWARDVLLEQQDRSVGLAHRAGDLGANVVLRGRSAGGPWVVKVIGRDRHLVFAGRDLVELLEFGLERFARGADDTGIRWIAESDGVAHGQPERGRAVWTLCHRPALDERLKHPERIRCLDCWRALDREVAA